MKNFKDTFSEALASYKSNVGLFTKIYILPIILLYIVGFLVSNIYFLDGSEESFLRLSTLDATIVLISGLLLGLLSIAGTIALTKAVGEPTTSTIGTAYSFAFKIFFQYLFVFVLVFFVISFFLLCGATLATVLTAIGSPIMTALAVILVPICLIVAILFAIWFSFTSFVVVFEGLKGVKAIKASYAYVKGNTLSVFKNIAILTLIAFVVVFVIQLPLSFIFGENSIVASGVDFVSSLIFTPLSVCFFYVMYQDLRNQQV